MKRVKWIIIILLVLVVIGVSYYLLGDVNQEDVSVNPTASVEKPELEEGYEFYLEKYELIDDSKNINVIIEYPQIIERDKSEIKSKINSMLKEQAISYYEAEYSNGLNLEIKAEIMYNDSNLLSVKYDGLSHYNDTMKINNILFATNVDLKTASLIKLEDVFNDNFQQKLNRDIFVYNGLDKVDEGGDIDSNSHEYGYVNADKSIIDEMFHQYYSNLNSEKYYFGENYLSVIVKVPSGPLVYLELSASYSDLSDCVINNVIWDKILKSE